MKAYYKQYLSFHKNKNCIRLHFLGQWVTLISIFIIYYYKTWYFIPLVPFVIYPFAWLGHFLFEKNKPAALKNPIKAKIADWIMFIDILKGKINIW